MQQTPATPPSGNAAASPSLQHASNPLMPLHGLQASTAPSQGMQVPSPPPLGTIQALLDLVVHDH